MATDYRDIIDTLAAYLAADATVTALLGTTTIGGVASQANSIFYGPSPQPPVFPCISLRAFGPYSAASTLHENPHAFASLEFEVTVFGEESSMWDIQAEVDERMERANLKITGDSANDLTDSASWAIKDINVAGSWVNVDVRPEISKDAVGQNLVQRTKTYTILAADKGI